MDTQFETRAQITIEIGADVQTQSIIMSSRSPVDQFFSFSHQFYDTYRTTIFVATSTVMAAWLFNRFYINRLRYTGQHLMRGKTVLITGANTGIGYETAKDLLRRGARVVLACRNTKKGNEAIRQLLVETGCSSENVRLMECDLSSFNSVRSFAKLYNEGEERLDVLICNAGISSATPAITKDGYNVVIESNYLGHFLLTHCLLEKLKACRPSRILNVSSKLHQNIRSVDWNDAFKQEHAPRWLGAYPISKLFQILATYKWKQTLLAEGVNIFALTPGWVATSLSDPSAKAIGWIPFLFSYPLTRMIKFIFAKTPKTGAQTVIYCAVEPALDTSEALYFQNCTAAQPSALATDPVAAEKLWNMSLEAVGMSS